MYPGVKILNNQQEVFMKTLFTLALLTISLITLAHPDDGKMTINNLSNQQIVVEVDGKKYENGLRGNDDLIFIPDLPAGFHTLKIYSVSNSRTAVNNMKRIHTLIFQRNLSLRAQYHVDIVINRFGKVLYDELSMRDRRYADMSRDRDRGRDDDRPGGGRPDRGNYPDQHDGYNNRVMQPPSFNAFKETLIKERFDNSKLAIARQVIDQNYFSADQVKQLAQLFSSDNSKLDIVKYAYRNTVNKQDYFLLYDVFTFSTSKEELASYIKQYK